MSIKLNIVGQLNFMLSGVPLMLMRIGIYLRLFSTLAGRFADYVLKFAAKPTDEAPVSKLDKVAMK